MRITFILGHLQNTAWCYEKKPNVIVFIWWVLQHLIFFDFLPNQMKPEDEEDIIFRIYDAAFGGNGYAKLQL